MKPSGEESAPKTVSVQPTTPITQLDNSPGASPRRNTLDLSSVRKSPNAPSLASQLSNVAVSPASSASSSQSMETHAGSIRSIETTISNHHHHHHPPHHQYLPHQHSHFYPPITTTASYFIKNNSHATSSSFSSTQSTSPTLSTAVSPTTSVISSIDPKILTSSSISSDSSKVIIQSTPPLPPSPSNPTSNLDISSTNATKSSSAGQSTIIASQCTATPKNVVIAASASPPIGSSGNPDTIPSTSSHYQPHHSSASGSNSSIVGNHAEDWNPNQIVYRKMEEIIERMQDEQTGVPVRTVKSFMSKIPSVFTGADLISWMLRNLELDDSIEALHLANLLSAHGYIFPIDEHMLSVRNDTTFYRFQTPYYWPSKCNEPENSDYAVFLCKRTMQNKTRLELADYEAENLARLQKMFSRKWEFIFMQAEAQAKAYRSLNRVDKKRDKLERKVLDSQERAFWDVHRPVPGCVNTTELDIKKACRMNKPIKSTKHMSCAMNSGRISPVEHGACVDALAKEVDSLRMRLEHRIGGVKLSKVSQCYAAFADQWAEYDAFITQPEPSNPWISDSTDYWECERQTKDVPCRRVRRWAFSLKELLKDPAGREQFIKFLEKEFSAENLKFWDAVQELKCVHSKDVTQKVQEIWNEYLKQDANCPINIDSKSYEITKRNLEAKPNSRYIFDEAAGHVYQLMKNDSYPRYLRSEMYKEYLNGTKKKTSVKGLRGVIAFSTKKMSDQLPFTNTNASNTGLN